MPHNNNIISQQNFEFKTVFQIYAGLLYRQDKRGQKRRESEVGRPAAAQASRGRYITLYHTQDFRNGGRTDGYRYQMS